MFTLKQKPVDKPDNKDAIPDELIIELILAGNIDTFETIMRRYNQRLYRVARSILKDGDNAQDAVQQAYISAYSKLSSYAPKASFGAWLTKITINEALMIKRKPDNRFTIQDEYLENQHITDSDINPAVHHANNELAALIESAIEELPHDFRLVFILREIQQLTLRETAECLELNESTVKTRMHRARNLMQKSLSRHINQAGMHVYEFAGQRCDHIVKTVLTILRTSHRDKYQSQTH